MKPTASARAGSASQPRVDVAGRALGSGLQDDGRLPRRKHSRHQERLPRVHRAMPPLETVQGDDGCDRRKQVQGGESPRSQLHEWQDEDADDVGYNVQTAFDTERHLIIAHEVTNVGSDRHQLKRMSGWHARRSDRRNSQRWPIAATTAARRSRPATMPASCHWCPRCSRRTARPRVVTTRAISSTSLSAMRSVVRPASMRSAAVVG